jgi:hypothetical protein
MFATRHGAIRAPSRMMRFEVGVDARSATYIVVRFAVKKAGRGESVI